MKEKLAIFFYNLAAKSIMVKTETNQWALKESVTFADWE